MVSQPSIFRRYTAMTQPQTTVPNCFPLPIRAPTEAPIMIMTRSRAIMKVFMLMILNQRTCSGRTETFICKD